MPLAHVGGASIVTRCLIARATIVLDEGPFDAQRWLDTVSSSQVTHVSVVPTMLKRVVERGARAPSSLRHVVVGGAACDDALVQRARALGFPVQRTYGMTETCSMVATESADSEGGFANVLEGVRATSIDGEICIAGPTLASGHWSADGISPLARDARGWFHTGDLGDVTADGTLRISGRGTDVIISGGENVHPAEVEAVLNGIDGVSAAVVYGEPDAEWGERVRAVVTLHGSTLDEVAAAMRARCSGHARPRSYAVLAEMPLLASGKVDRREAITLARASRELASS